MKLFFLFASCQYFMKKDTLKSWKSPALTKGTFTFLFSVCVWLCVYSWIGHGECVEGRLCHVGSGIELSAFIYITRLPICISVGSLLPISFRLDIIHCCGHLFLLLLWSFAFFIVLSHLTSRSFSWAIASPLPWLLRSHGSPCECSPYPSGALASPPGLDDGPAAPSSG